MIHMIRWLKKLRWWWQMATDPRPTSQVVHSATARIRELTKDVPADRELHDLWRSLDELDASFR